MKTETLDAVKAILLTDSTVGSQHRQLILDACRHPDSVARKVSPVKTAVRYLSVKTVAERMDVSVRTVQRWIADGNLPSVLVRGSRRIAESDLKEMVAEHNNAGQDDTPPVRSGRAVHEFGLEHESCVRITNYGIQASSKSAAGLGLCRWHDGCLGSAR